MVSRTAEYALRIMVVIQRHTGDGFVLARDVSAEADVPAPYVSTILHRLRHAGLVIAERGPGGGYGLKMPGEKITVFDIISVFDDVDAHRRCILGHQICNDATDCPVHETWDNILCTYDRFLHDMTLDTLAGAKRLTDREKRTARGRARGGKGRSGKNKSLKSKQFTT